MKPSSQPRTLPVRSERKGQIINFAERMNVEALNTYLRTSPAAKSNVAKRNRCTERVDERGEHDIRYVHKVSVYLCAAICNDKRLSMIFKKEQLRNHLRAQPEMPIVNINRWCF